MTICFVIISTDVEFLGLSPTLHFNFTALAFLLAENSGVVQSSPLRFQLQSKQTLRTRDQAAVQRHVDVACFNVLQDVIFLALEPDVHLILEIEQCLSVELGTKLNLVSNFAPKIQLDALVEVH